jgi:hypothetical protein
MWELHLAGADCYINVLLPFRSLDGMEMDWVGRQAK